MGFLSKIAGIAAPLIGTALGGPVGGAIGSAVGGFIAGGGDQGQRAAGQATEQQLAAIQGAQDRVNQGAVTSQNFLQPLAGVGQRGVDLSGFLGDPQAQAELAFNNPIFQLSRQALTEDINRSAASRGRLTAGDTLEQLQNAGAVAAQPFIDRQRQDILNLLGISQNVSGQQVGVEQNASQQIADLLTGGGATQAAGTIAQGNAATAQRGNIFDIGSQLAGNQDIQNLLGGLFNSTPPPSSGSFNNAPVIPGF